MGTAMDSPVPHQPARSMVPSKTYSLPSPTSIPSLDAMLTGRRL